MNCLYTIPLCNFGFAFRHATSVIVKDFGKALLKKQILPDFLFIQTIRKETVIWNCPLAEFKSFVMNNKAFGNLFCNSQKSFHTAPGSSDSNNRGYRSFFKINNGICIYKKS